MTQSVDYDVSAMQCFMVQPVLVAVHSSRNRHQQKRNTRKQSQAGLRENNQTRRFNEMHCLVDADAQRLVSD